MRFATPVLAACLCATAACSSEMSSANRLDETLRAYHHHLLAHDQERASAYVTEAAMDAFLAMHGDDGNAIEMEDFQVLSVRFLPKKDPKDNLQALVLINLDARRKDSIVVKPLRLAQTWEQKGQRWVMVETGIAPTRPRGAEAPGDEKAPP
jgi:hypothetical protein